MHPQAWPEELDYTGGRVVVIGSGATAVTLVPAMAERAAHVTMLQRSPSYVLAVPDGDLFRVIREGRASVVTGPIDTFTEQGLRLRSGEELAADIIATATGLDMLAFGGIEIGVDGEVRNPGEAMSYKGMMLCDVPNPAFAMGYINTSPGPLKCELTCEHVCRLLRYIDRRGGLILSPAHDRADPSLERRQRMVEAVHLCGTCPPAR